MENVSKTKPSFILVLILGLLTAFGALSIDMYLPALPEISKEFETTTSSAQLTLTFFMIGLAIGQVFAGPMSDVIGRKKPLIVALIIYTTVSLLSVFTRHIEMLIVLRFIQGFAGGAGAVLSRAISSDLYKGKALTKFLAVLMLVNGVAPIIAPILGGFILAFSEWKTVFIVLTIFGALMLVLSILKLNESLAKEKRTSGNIKKILIDFKNLLKTPKFILPMLIQGSTYAILFSYISASPFIVQSIYHLTAQQFSLMFAFNGLGLIVAGQLIGKLVDYYNEHILMRLFGAIQIFGGIIVIFTLINHWHITLLMLGFFILISPVAAIGTAGFSIAMANHNSGIGSASSLLGLMQFAFGAVVTPIVGLMGETSIIPYITIVITFSIILIILFIINYKVFKH